MKKQDNYEDANNETTTSYDNTTSGALVVQYTQTDSPVKREEWI